MTNDCFRRLILSGAFLLPPTSLMAQSVSTGSITGVVRDTSGARASRRDGGGGQPGVDRESSVGGDGLVRGVPDHGSAPRHLFGHVHARRVQHRCAVRGRADDGVYGDGQRRPRGREPGGNDYGFGCGAGGRYAERVAAERLRAQVTRESAARIGHQELCDAGPRGGRTPPGVDQDVGGSKGEYSQSFMIHGGRGSDFQQLRDGMFFGTLVAAGNWMTSLNPATVAETTVQTSSGGAELESGGVLINVVPRDGGNVFSGTFNGNSRPARSAVGQSRR